MRSYKPLDASELEVTALFDISVVYLPRDRETGEPGRHYATAKFAGAVIGSLVLTAEDAVKAMGAGAAEMVKRLEQQVAEEAAADADLARAA